jgi:chitinase
MPTQALDVKVELVTFPLGDFNYPINPKMRITNNSTVALPPGVALAFDMGTSAPSSGIRNQSSWTIAVQSGHDGGNVGGLRGDFHRVTLTMPTWMSGIPVGGSTEIDFVYTLPAATTSPARS